MSVTNYLSSFVPSLIEETHFDLSSSLYGVHRAPFCEILTAVPERSRSFIPTRFFLYQISVHRTDNDTKDVGKYAPEVGDLIALTDIKPKTIEDLNRPRRYYHIAYVCGSKESTGEISILSNKCIDMENNSSYLSNNTPKLYAVSLLNLTTNIRVWKALNSELEGANMNMIKKVLQASSNVRIAKLRNSRFHCLVSCYFSDFMNFNFLNTSVSKNLLKYLSIMHKRQRA
jgi:senataxin